MSAVSQARALLEDAHARGIEPTIVQSSGATIIVLAMAARARRSDLLAWMESRSVKPIAGLDDLDIERRIKRLERERTEAVPKPGGKP